MRPVGGKLPLKLIVLGAGPAYTDRAGALGSSYLVVHDGRALALDIGQGAFTALARAWEPTALTGVVVSHLHPDHFIDLVPLRHFLRYEFDPPRRVRVLAPDGLARRLDALHDQPGFTAEALDVVRLSPGVRRIGPFELEAALVTHTTESYAFRVTAGGREPGIVYSGDCGRWQDLRSLVRPGDVLLTEVSFGPGPVTPGAQHLDGPGVAELARASSPSRVLLTHLQMGFDPARTLDAVRDGFGGDVSFVWPGDRLTI